METTVHRLFFADDIRTLFTLLLNSVLEFAVRPIEVGGDKIDELPYLRIKKEIADELSGIVPLNRKRRAIWLSRLMIFCLAILKM